MQFKATQEKYIANKIQRKSDLHDCETSLESDRHVEVNESYKTRERDSRLNIVQTNDVNSNKPLSNLVHSYIDLPSYIKAKKAVINVKNYDEQCIKWALLSALYPAQHSDRVSSYFCVQNKLNFNNITFPLPIIDLNKIDINNNISINVFGLEYSAVTMSHNVTGPLYITKTFNNRHRHVNLLYVTQGNKGHYCYIKKMSRLVNKQLTSRNEVLHICDGCLLYFKTNEALGLHKSASCADLRFELLQLVTSREDGRLLIRSHYRLFHTPW